MATGLTADAMLAALKKWGITPKFYRDNWRTHNRNAAQGWGPINGHIVHNFGSDTSDSSSLAYLYNGDLARGMPGPLSQFAITDDGQLWIIGWGAANHTGYMEKGIHELVLRDAAPLDRDYRPTTSGSTPSAGIGKVNYRYTAVEMCYGSAPTDVQRRTNLLLSAALMDALGPGYTGGSLAGHRECTTQRSDPVGIPMGEHRRQVNALLKAGPPGAQPPTPAPVLEEDIMASIDDLRKVIREEIYGGRSKEAQDRVLGGIPAGAAYTRKNPDGSAARVLDSADGNLLRTVLVGIAEKVGAPVDVDESAIAAALLAGLAPQVADAVTAAVAAGVPTAELADAVVARLGERLNPTA